MKIVRVLRRHSLIAAACLFLAAGCELIGFYKGGEAIIAADPEAPFVVELGQTAVLDDLGAAIRFTEVSDDSRCPRNVYCAWAGRVRAAFVVTAGGRSAPFTIEGWVDEEPREDGPAVEVEGLQIQLRALAPYPRADPETGEQVEQGTPTATLFVVKA